MSYGKILYRTNMAEAIVSCFWSLRVSDKWQQRQDMLIFRLLMPVNFLEYSEAVTTYVWLLYVVFDGERYLTRQYHSSCL